MTETSLLILAATLSTALGAAYAAFVSRFWLRRGRPIRERYNEARQLFFQNLSKSISLDLLHDIEGASRLRKAVADEVASYRFRNTTTEQLLDAYLAETIATKDEVGEETAVARYNIVLQLINEHRRVEPFNSLPETERYIAQTLQESIDNGANQDASQRLKELTTALASRLEEATTKSTRNSRLSVAGFALSFLSLNAAITLFFIGRQLGS